MDVFIGTDIKAESLGHFQSPTDMHIIIDPFGNVTWTRLLSGIQLLAPPWTVAHQTPLSTECPGKNTGVGCRLLLQRMKSYTSIKVEITKTIMIGG